MCIMLLCAVLTCVVLLPWLARKMYEHDVFKTCLEHLWLQEFDIPNEKAKEIMSKPDKAHQKMVALLSEVMGLA